MIWAPMTIICVDTWNFNMEVFAIHDDKWLKALCTDAANRFYLLFGNVINYDNDVITAADSYKSVKSVSFSDVQTVAKIVV